MPTIAEIIRNCASRIAARAVASGDCNYRELARSLEAIADLADFVEDHTDTRLATGHLCGPDYDEIPAPPPEPAEDD